MTRRMSLVALGAVAGALAVLFPLGKLPAGSIANAASQETYEQLNLFGDVFEHILSEYVDQIDEATLIQAAIDGMVSTLDPHSAYLAPVGFEDVRIQTQGSFGGVGIQVTSENEAVVIVSPIRDTPGERAGLLAGDVIAAVDGVEPTDLDDAVNRMRGDPGTDVVLTIRRQGLDEPFDVTIERDIIEVQSVAGRVEGGDVGYIRVSTFSAQTAEDLEALIGALLEEAPDLVGFVIDLRLNPGGLFEEAIEVADVFMERGEVLSTRGRGVESIVRYVAEEGDATGGLPVIVLVNAGTASSSEIVAGALKDHERATILGTPTFGKGSVQTVIPLSDGGALRITTQRYYTPSGTSIQAVGIEPDIVVRQQLTPEQLEALNLVAVGEASLDGHLESQNGEETAVTAADALPPPADPEADTQLQYALALLRGEEPPESGPTLAPASEAGGDDAAESSGQGEAAEGGGGEE